MRILLIILWWPFGLFAQSIEVDETDQFQPIVYVANAYDSAMNTDSVQGMAKELLKMTQIINGKLAPVNVSGKYAIKEGAIIFSPLTKLGAGLEFEITYGSATKKYKTPKRTLYTLPAYVEAVFPSSQNVPRNILFFHIQFSTSMRYDISGYENVRILDNSGTELPLLWRQRSYWLEDQKLLVLMIHPGKVKRGIEMDIPFQIGETYTLEVLPTMKDVQGKNIAQPYQHPFTITKEDYDSPKILFDDFKLPKADSRKPITLLFSEGMDHSSILSGVKVYDANNQQMEGVFSWDANDQVFDFTPNKPWGIGKYEIVFEKKVCDFANNRLNRPFEMTEMNEVKKDQVPVIYSFEL